MIYGGVPSHPPEDPVAPPSEDEVTHAWVAARYAELGFTAPAAEEFAMARGDWHVAQHLLLRGWSHEQIVAVLL